MRNYVIINGVNSLTIQGLAIKTMPPITKPIQRTLREEIDGRDGDIVTTLGYGAYDKTIEIGLFGTFDIDEVIAYFNQKGTITFSNEADKVYYFEALDQVDYAELLKFRTANVVLHCQPFKYPTEETPLEEEYEYVTGTGTNITLDNTEETEFNEIEIQGNTSQATYTGKNKIPTSDTISTTGTTSNGITFTLLSDGTIKANGTATAGVSIYLTNDWLVFPAGTYTISDGIASGQSGTTFFLFADVQHSSGSAWDEKYFSTAGSFTRQIEETFRFRPRIVVRQGQTLNNLIFKPQFETGSSPTDYEPYVGGIPSPNPNYPQDIHVVSGDNVVEITGRNLLDTTKMIDFTPSGTTWYSVDGISGFYNESNISRGQCYYEIEAGKTYTFSVHEAINKSTSASAPIQLVNRTGGLIVSIQQGYTSNTFTATETGRAYPRMSINTANQPAKCVVQLEHGNQVHDFEEYQNQSLPLTLGVPNLIDETEATLGTISQSDGVTIGSSSSVYYIPSYIDVKPNEAYSFKYNGTSNITIRAFYYNASKTYLSTAVVSGSNSNQVTFTIPTNAYYLRIQYGSGYYNQGLQLTKGDTPQTISTTPIEMASMPLMNYKDVFVKEEDKWYKRTQIGKFTIGQWASVIGNTTYYQTNFNSTNGIMSFRLPKSQFDNFNLPQSANIYKGFSDNFTGAGSNLWNHTNQLYKFGYVDGLIFGILYTDIGLDTWTTSARSFETELTNYLGDVTFYLPLKEETDIEITNETLADQLEAIKNAISYKGQTNITQTNNDAPFILDLSALKENSDHLVIDNIGNIYSKPTLDLEGTGIVDIYLNDTQMFEVDLSEKNEIVIDTDKMEAYNPTDNTLANRQVTGDYSKFKLDSGENDLRFSGDLTKATITRYKRWL